MLFIDVFSSVSLNLAERLTVESAKLLRIKHTHNYFWQWR